MDQDTECVEHVWLLLEVFLGDEGSLLRQECRRCGLERFTPPDESVAV